MELLVVIMLVFVPTFVSAFFYLRSLQRTLERCSVESRTLSPGKVWLLLIPLFNLVWNFVVVINISISLRNEFTRRAVPGIDAEPGKGIGLAMFILAACSVIPILGVFTWIAGFICWVVYWVKINDYSQKLLLPVNAIAPAGPPPL